MPCCMTSSPGSRPPLSPGKRYDVLREELKRLSRVADATPPCAPLAAVVEETPRGAAGSADPTPRPAAVADNASPTDSGAGSTNNTVAAAAAAWQGQRPGELDGLDEDSVDPMIALYLA